MSERFPKPSPTDADVLTAREFLRQYAEKEEFFTGGDALQAMRAANVFGIDRDWKNVWAANVINYAAHHDVNWIRRSARQKPKSKQSHTGSLVRWQSNIYTGVKSLTGGSAREEIRELAKEWRVSRERGEPVLLEALLWKAYELGVDTK